jgi:hypothetical protein
VPGEHVTVIGDTGTGKSYLIAKLVRLRQFVVVFKTKPDPDDSSKWRGFQRSRYADAMANIRYQRILLQPEYRHQPREGWRAMESAWQHGGWTFVIDELLYAERLGLREQIERLLTQGRSKFISTVVGMQRPAWTTRFAISQSTHLFTFRLEGRDIKTVSDATTPRIVPVIESLNGHDFAYFNRRDRTVMVGNARRLGAIFENRDGGTLDKAGESGTVEAGSRQSAVVR